MAACKKEKPAATHTAPPIAVNSLYADSILFINNTGSKNIVKPVETAAGTFKSFPDGLKIDDTTGAIDVNSSETGLKFQVTFTSSDGTKVITAFITISGINYKDKIYNLSAGDSVVKPIYNADKRNAIPQLNSGSSFDNDGGCKNAGIEVNPTDATINLAKSVRDQRIDTGSTQEVKLQYKINDQSHQAMNGLNLKIYFYRTASEIPQYLTDLLKERQTTILSENPSLLFPLTRAAIKNFSSIARRAQAPSRPRPPCIIVVSR
ncbi:MAG: hypothetical protein M3N14_08195 [Bacteroidota bacterium]|nr:hypothetical protein [Bacteroidota bacterium]